MKYFIIVLLVFVASTNIIAQSNTEIIQNEIDQTVWKPFKNAFESLDAETLNAIYAKKVLRVTPEGVDTKQIFKYKNIERFKQYKKEGLMITLDFWFDSRHTNENTSYEVGFFRITTIANKNIQYSYGQFHIVLQKIGRSWRITQDWDSDHINGKKINAQDFQVNEPLRF
ncbi:hypothetical protein ABN763_16975 [Spongiivirga sp. MCCC 1A20706]|uniref:hypothetical protein n=1 Tax=Spongiivirga sp. MCCC 1A20706 TaxID=3160963 RepID=UPI00397738FD